MKIIQFTDEFKKWLKENNVSLKHAESRLLTDIKDYCLLPIINGKNKIPKKYGIGTIYVRLYFDNIKYNNANINVQYDLQIGTRKSYYGKAYLINFKPQLIKIFGKENAEIVEKEISAQFIKTFYKSKNGAVAWTKIPKSLKYFRKLLMVS